MDIREYIESGILELYVYGILPEEEMMEISDLSEKHEEIKAEILSIEKAIISLSYSFSPHLSAENFEKIRARLIEKYGGVVNLRSRRSISPYLGWAAAVLLLIGIGFQYYHVNEAEKQAETSLAENAGLKVSMANLQEKHQQNENILAIIRHKNNNTISLQGQGAAPEAHAKVYMNTETRHSYVDVAGLPKPPEGKVYQVWAIKLNPMTPTSIGLVDNTEENKGIIPIDHFDEAEAFGITLEPAGGSETPTMDQLYTLGKV